MKTIFEDDELFEKLEEEIKENVEWLEDVDGDERECISTENLEGILSRFFNRKIYLKQ